MGILGRVTGQSGPDFQISTAPHGYYASTKMVSSASIITAMKKRSSTDRTKDAFKAITRKGGGKRGKRDAEREARERTSPIAPAAHSSHAGTQMSRLHRAFQPMQKYCVIAMLPVLKVILQPQAAMAASTTTSAWAVRFAARHTSPRSMGPKLTQT